MCGVRRRIQVTEIVIFQVNAKSSERGYLIPNLNYLVESSIGITALFFLIIFLPAIIELKKPKDCGPRLITYFNEPNGAILNQLVNIEADEKNSTGLTNKFFLDFNFVHDIEASI
jgi:hypothetical protein